jgi:hypothetical protein
LLPIASVVIQFQVPFCHSYRRHPEAGEPVFIDKLVLSFLEEAEVDIILPTVWTSISHPSFLYCLKRAYDFHDSGFFKYDKSDESLEILLNPVFFGVQYGYSYQNLNACRFRLCLASDVTKESLDTAAEAFEVMKIIVGQSWLRFDFVTCSLELEVQQVESMFRFVSLPDGEDYWSEVVKEIK